MPDARSGTVLVLTAGTGDLPVAREAAAVLTAYGHHAPLVADVGVAGLHRVLAHQQALAEADVVVVVAGMEGALASVAAGLHPRTGDRGPDQPGLRVGARGGDRAAGDDRVLQSGVTVVGIDNGFGAACAAAPDLGAPRRPGTAMSSPTRHRM